MVQGGPRIAQETLHRPVGAIYAHGAGAVVAVWAFLQPGQITVLECQAVQTCLPRNQSLRLGEGNLSLALPLLICWDSWGPARGKPRLREARRREREHRGIKAKEGIWVRHRVPGENSEGVLRLG